MTVEAPERLISSFKQYEVLIQPDPNRHESGELLNEYPVDRFFPVPAVHRIEISPFLPKNSPLEKAGFLLHNQMVNFINTVNEGKLEEAVAELTVEIRAHANEYPKEAPLLVGSVKRTEKGIVNKYNGEPVINHLDWQERDGATARGSVDLNKKVMEADKDGSAVQVSPSGWNGKYPDYKKTQIVFFQAKEGEELNQLTFVLSYKLENCINVFEKMGVSRVDLVCADSRETIKRLVGQAVKLDADSELSNPKNFIYLLKEENPNDPALKIIERDLERHLRGEDISVLPKECEEYMTQLESFIFQNAEKLADFISQVEVSNTIEETIYKIAEYIRGSRPKSLYLSTSRGLDWRDKYMGVIEDLRQISGCAGGGIRGSKSVMALGGIFTVGSRFYSSSSFLSPEKGDYHLGSCESCKRENVLVGDCSICTDCEKAPR